MSVQAGSEPFNSALLRAKEVSTAVFYMSVTLVLHLFYITVTLVLH